MSSAPRDHRSDAEARERYNDERAIFFNPDGVAPLRVIYRLDQGP
jgi:hypothetical protein